MKKLKEGIKRFWLMYHWYVIFLATATWLAISSYFWAKPIKASFSENSTTAEATQENSRVRYKYFLDYSPSMKGFFNMDVNSVIHTIADIFQDLNRNNEENQFFRCMDVIDTVPDATTFYGYMKSQEGLEEYYTRAANNIQFPTDMNTGESNDEENAVVNVTDQIISKIDLTKIFTENYTNESDTSVDDLYVIITDMNFLANEEDWEGHNEHMSDLARYLGQEAVGCNICIYAINSNFSGIANDEAIYSDRSDITSVMFYLIIFSDNENAYKKYCQQMEENFTASGITYAGKFELLNHLRDTNEILHVDLNAYKGLDVIEKQNINFANELFKDLKKNEFAIQLVSEGGSCILNMPVSTITIPGYYNMTPDGYDDTKLEIEVDTYYPQNKLIGNDTYELYDETPIVSGESARMFLYDEKWYIRINLNLNSALDLSRKSIFNNINLRYLVLNVNIYMLEPSFSKPDWLDHVTASERYDSQMLNIDTVVKEIMQSKAKSYVSKSKDERYLGNVVIYVLY